MAKILLEKLLKQKNLSKRQFSIRLGVDYPNTMRFFKSTYDPKLSMLERWAKILNVKIKDLYEE